MIVKNRIKSAKRGSTRTIKTYLEELRSSKSEYQKKRVGAREQLYRSMQVSQRIIVVFLKNDSLKSAFVKTVERGGIKVGCGVRKKFDLSLEVVAAATGSNRKLASKYARVLDYLRLTRIDVKKTAETIRSERLEDLYRKATKKRRKAKAPAKEAPSDDSAKGRKPQPSNDKQVSLPISLKLSDRDALLEADLDTIFHLIARRVPEAHGIIQVRHITAGSDTNDADEW